MWSLLGLVRPALQVGYDPAKWAEACAWGDEVVFTPQNADFLGIFNVVTRQVSLSSRLVDSPAIVVGHESAAMRRMMSMVQDGQAPKLAPQKLEINAGHPIIRDLAAIREEKADLAALIAQQIFSNALIAAG